MITKSEFLKVNKAKSSKKYFLKENYKKSFFHSILLFLNVTIIVIAELVKF